MSLETDRAPCVLVGAHSRPDVARPLSLKSADPNVFVCVCPACRGGNGHGQSSDEHWWTEEGAHCARTKRRVSAPRGAQL